MTDDDARAALQALLDARPETASREEIAEWLAIDRRLRSRLDAFAVRCTRRARELSAEGRAEPAEALIGMEAGLSSKDADRAGEREKVCSETADVEDALADGEVSAGHVDAIARVARSLDPDCRRDFLAREAELLAAARRECVDVFVRRCRRIAKQIIADRSKNEGDELEQQRRRSRVKRWVDDTTGMHHTHVELDPQRDTEMWTAIAAHLNALRDQSSTDGRVRPYRQLEVDALVAAVASGGAGSPLERVPEITVLIDWRTLHDGYHSAGLCETEDGVPLPVDTVRRLCCDAEIIPTVLGSDGAVLDQGRSVRTASRDQRRALRSMHRTCAHPRCTMPFSACKIHHIRWWWRDRGPTDIANLLPLCEHHHHQVHEGGWILTMTPDRVATWTRPDGTVWHTGTAIDRAPGGVYGSDGRRRQLATH